MEILVTIPLITAIVSALKMAGLPAKYAPIASMLVGITIIAMVTDFIWTDEIILGVIMGLSASGLYSGGKTLLTK